MKEILRRLLSQREKHCILDTNRVPAAVLVPILFREGAYHILFTKRTEIVKYHKGQISFPGGAFEEKDANLLNTALRESTEEIGIKPDDIDVLGELDDTLTQTSNFVITPFVATIAEIKSLKFNPLEIEEMLEVPIPALLDKSRLHQTIESFGGEDGIAYTYSYQGKVIWGATAKILNQFLDIFTEVMSINIEQ